MIQDIEPTDDINQKLKDEVKKYWRIMKCKGIPWNMSGTEIRRSGLPLQQKRVDLSEGSNMRSV